MRIIKNINKVVHDDNECLMNDCLRTNELLVIDYLIANCKDTNDTIPKPAHTPFHDIIRTKMLPVYLFYNMLFNGNFTFFLFSSIFNGKFAF